MNRLRLKPINAVSISENNADIPDCHVTLASPIKLDLLPLEVWSLQKDFATLPPLKGTQNQNPTNQNQVLFNEQCLLIFSVVNAVCFFPLFLLAGPALFYSLKSHGYFKRNEHLLAAQYGAKAKVLNLACLISGNINTLDLYVGSIYRYAQLVL